jgi:hypothetical protein
VYHVAEYSVLGYTAVQCLTFPKKSVDFHQTARLNNPEGSIPHSDQRNNPTQSGLVRNTNILTTIQQPTDLRHVSRAVLQQWANKHTCPVRRRVQTAVNGEFLFL